ncbi:MAG: energy-coupled thiamine transporter ThiT [Clostridia bacterium]|nr:energy-coupled thiamine transporter ThiT [Clostridia bacterium]
MSNTRKSPWSVQMLAVGAVSIALSSVLSVITLFSMPNGGSVTPASMLPLMLFAFVYGPVPGVAVGAVYGILQFLLGGWFLSIPQFLLDYPVAFAMTGLAGLFWRGRHQRTALTLGILLASVMRFIVATLAGVIFWSDLTNGAWAAIVYSVGYNASYMVWECVICVALGVAVGPRLVKELRKVK